MVESPAPLFASPAAAISAVDAAAARRTQVDEPIYGSSYLSYDGMCSVAVGWDEI